MDFLFLCGFFFPSVEVGPAVFTFHVLQDTELVQPGLNWHAQPAWGKLPPVVTHSCLLATVTVTAGRKGRLGSHRLFKESSMTKINPCLLCTLSQATSSCPRWSCASCCSCSMLGSRVREQAGLDAGGQQPLSGCIRQPALPSRGIWGIPVPLGTHRHSICVS